ncbi:MAG: preprotein translocase subunit Sec61beta [Promethearchaeota archaeon]
MSTRRRKSKKDAPMPATGAGLIRFYSEADSPGIGIGPMATMIIPVVLMVIIVAAYLLA